MKVNFASDFFGPKFYADSKHFKIAEIVQDIKINMGLAR